MQGCRWISMTEDGMIHISRLIMRQCQKRRAGCHCRRRLY